VWYATFFAGLTGSSSSEKVRSITSEFLLLPGRGADEASRDESGVMASERGVGTVSCLIADIRESVMSTRSSESESSWAAP
jgi:hypothetical protein